MKRKSVQPDHLLEIDVHGKIDAIFVDRTLLRAARGIAEYLADICHGELDAVFLERIWQKAEGRFLHRALAGIRIGWLQIVGLLVFLRERSLQGAQRASVPAAKR
ncbi:hypothetical protein [Bradyrhizobium japonicum]|uniref:hypothetical protein n=1 Tax=Bradyrhizobium japonicum TaxID=375 RepID=UPI0020122AB6|nr:hypothetical protein [Bradyrhizobium japonicum]